jgi:protein-disulfide isomerase
MSDLNNEKDSKNLGVPVAIVIAGGLIALAVYFGGGQSTTGNGQILAVEDEEPIPTQLAKVDDLGVGDIRPVSSDDWIRGTEDAPVTFIEYSDFECPYCKRFHETMIQIMKEYDGKVQWVYRHFPLDQLHKQARQEAVAVECAGEQGKGWEMIDKIYEVTPSNDGLDLNSLPRLATEVGVTNVNQFNECLNSGKYDDKVAADLSDAQAAGGRGTPYSIVITANGDKIPVSGAQPIDKVRSVIETALEE